MNNEEMPLESAMAWVFSRDIKFVRYTETSIYQPVELAFSTYCSLDGTHYEAVCANWAEAWRLLRDQLIGKCIEVRGVRSVPGRAPTYLTFEGERFLSPPPSPISAEFLSMAMLEEDASSAVLYFRGNRNQGELRWHNVDVDQGPVFEAFPDIMLKGKRSRNQHKAYNNQLASAKRIAMARDDLWPDGNILVKPGERNRQIVKWLEDRELSAEGLSKSTLDRFFDPRNTSKT